MKQRITVEQINELTDLQKSRIQEWWNPSRGDFSLAWLIGRDDIPFAHDDIVIGQSTIWGKGDEQYFTYDAPETTDNDGSCEYYRKECMLPLLSIGQMCQFMDEHSPIAYCIAMVQFYSPKVIVPNREEDNEKAELMMHMVNRIELCDYLWEVVKEVLK